MELRQRGFGGMVFMEVSEGCERFPRFVLTQPSHDDSAVCNVAVQGCTFLCL